MSQNGLTESSRLPSISSTTDSPVLECKDLNAGYGETLVVRNFSLSCSAGEIVGLIGPNGCGKSTLLKRLAGLLPDAGGSIRACGQEAKDLSPRQLSDLGLQYVPQLRDVFPSLTVEENLFVGATDATRLARTLELFPILSDLLKRKAGRLSGGERKVVAIARAFMHPHLEVLLLDEPSAGLSPKATAALWPTIRATTMTGVGVVVVEQRVDEVLKLADRAYVMVAGKRRASAECSVLRGKRDDIARMFVEA